MIDEDDLQGHWQRDWIKAPGFEDHTTRVHWMQAGALFADIRVQQDRPDLTGRHCLADLTQAELSALMAAEGFAGTITVADNSCTWRREINWHGVPEVDDIGLMSFQDAALIEEGVLADYSEQWQRQPTAPLRGHRLDFGDQRGVLIENDSIFLVAVGPPPSGTSVALEQALKSGDASDAAMRAHFASTYCLGRWQGTEGRATLSTNPFCEGKVVVTRTPALQWHAVSFDGETSAHPLRAA